jgi:DNA-binding XRE family transcriptional regulator
MLRYRFQWLIVRLVNDSRHKANYSGNTSWKPTTHKSRWRITCARDDRRWPLSQKQLADLAGITRQAVSALETSQYSPATSVALQLARLVAAWKICLALNKPGEIIEGELLGALPQSEAAVRAQVTQIGDRVVGATVARSRGTRQPKRGG